MTTRANSLVRLILSDGSYRKPCDDCKHDAARGWMPVAEMRELFNRECGELCTCEFEFEVSFTEAQERQFEAQVLKENPWLPKMADAVRRFLGKK